MSKNIVANKYILPYQSNNIPWYERDGLMTYMYALKCKRFLEKTDEHFENVEIVNFDLIYQRSRHNPLVNSVKDYKTAEKKFLKGYSKKNQNKALSSAFRNK